MTKTRLVNKTVMKPKITMNTINNNENYQEKKLIITKTETIVTTKTTPIPLKHTDVCGQTSCQLFNVSSVNFSRRQQMNTLRLLTPPTAQGLHASVLIDNKGFNDVTDC